MGNIDNFYMVLAGDLNFPSRIVDWIQSNDELIADTKATAKKFSNF